MRRSVPVFCILAQSGANGAQNDKPRLPWHVSQPAAAPGGGGQCVLLVGPHKTGSSHIQSFISTQAAYLRRNGWVWPSPMPGNPSGKEFYPLVDYMMHDKQCPDVYKECLGTRSRETEAACRLLGLCSDHFFEQVKQAIAQAMRSNLNVVIAMEEFDGAVADVAGSNLIKHLDELLAPCLRRTVTVMYRTPRVSHLLSAWGETRNYLSGGSASSFTSYVCEQYLQPAGCYSGGPPWHQPMVYSPWAPSERSSRCNRNDGPAHSVLPFKLASAFYAFQGAGHRVQGTGYSSASAVDAAQGAGDRVQGAAVSAMATYDIVLVDMHSLVIRTVPCTVYHVPCTSTWIPC